MVKNHIHILGAGFSSLAASCYLAKQGYKVTVFEKNSMLGGRARRFEKSGFVFDMGPTWYWMPDVFERFFADFNKKPSDYYTLKRLDPSYQVYFDLHDSITMPSNLEEIYKIFERQEPGSAKYLRKFLQSAKDNYHTAIEHLVYKPGVSPFELITPKTLMKASQFFSTIRKKVRAHIKDNKLIQILEFPVLFLGAKPGHTPLFYNFMNYADFGLGTWHPTGGMYSVVQALENLGKELGVQHITQAAVEKIEVSNQRVSALRVNQEIIPSDIVLSGADYHHTESLLDPPHRQYTEMYWQKKVFSPSALLFYVGLNKKIQNVAHHTLFFDTDFDQHAKTIYDTPSWPKKPLFYVSFPSKTDDLCAPKGKESAIFLIPLAPGIEDTPEIREQYFRLIIDRFERITEQKVAESILFKKSFCVSDFVKDYHSYKGNAYGMANTLLQTAYLRPNIRSKKVKNLYFTGQLTVPGPGVPPALISGKIAAELIHKAR